MLSKDRFFQFAILLILLGGGIYPWISAQFETAYNTNHAWLFTAAGRLLDGGTLLRDAYETNPPFSILAYIPAVLLTNTGVPAQYAVYAAMMIAVTLSTVLMWIVLKPFAILETQDRMMLVAAYFLGALLVAPGIFFGERDHLVALALIPFMTVQIGLVCGYKYKTLRTLPLLVVCALVILIKPHFALIPALVFLHRVVWQYSLPKEERAALTDLWAGLIAGTLYLVLMVTVFSEYINYILPDVMSHYIAFIDMKAVVTGLSWMMGATMLAMLTLVMPIHPKLRPAIYGFIVSGIVALLLYLLQMKGFTYHLIPAHMLLYCGVTLLIFGLAQCYFTSAALQSFVLMTTLLTLLYTLHPLKPDRLTHEDYKDLALPKLVEACGAPCPFFIFTENMEMIWQTSFYTGQLHASRFPGMWWLHKALLSDTKTPEDEALQLKYADLVAEDLARWQPKMLAIATNFEDAADNKFDFIDYFSVSPAFKDEIGAYKKTRIMTDDRGTYFRGTSAAVSFPITYDIYMRQ